MTNNTTSRPNIILIMCDDLGYGDTGFNGNTIIKTPHLDAMREEGAAFTRFYAGGPVCSPTRGTCLTGRHYSRYGITHANRGCLPKQEITIATVAKELGYATGHFGKWHLGTLSMDTPDGNRGGENGWQVYAPPWERDFDVCFSTEAKVPTWDPMITPDEMNRKGQPKWGVPGELFGTHYWNEQGEQVTDNLAGDDSRVIVDRAEPFIRQAVEEDTPFFSVVWFHTPHTPVVAGPEYLAMYSDYDEDAAHYYGAVTAMDEQVGRLNDLVKELGIEADTMIWFCSDNGPEGGLDVETNGRSRGVTGGLRGRKRSLFNGGIGVPALVKWPGHVQAGTTITTPCSTLDYFPTIIDELGYTIKDKRPIDGISLLSVFNDERYERPEPIPFRFIEHRKSMFGSPTFALIDNRYKYMCNFDSKGRPNEQCIFDLIDDPGEQDNIIAQHQAKAQAYSGNLKDKILSFRQSHIGADYRDSCYQPVNVFQELSDSWSGE